MKRVFLLIILFGCASRASRPQPLIVESTGGLKVSVKSGGSEMAPDGYLVRVRLTPAEAERLERESYTLNGREAIDSSGVCFGFRISSAGALSILGLKPEDVVTALGKKVAPRGADFMAFFSSLGREKGDHSLTYDREGLPRKVIISVE